MVTVFLCLEKSVISFFELLFFHLFIGKGFYHTDTCQIILNLSIDFRNLYPVPCKCFFHFLIVKIRIHKHKRNKNKCRKRKHRADAHQDNKCTEYFNQGNHNIFRTMMHQFRDIKQIRGNSGHELSCFLVIIVGKR